MKRLMARVLITCFSVVVLASGAFGNSHAQRGDHTRYFSETGHNVKGRFLEYWEKNGGLPQQGYPISEEIQEVSDTDGKTYTVQYFERAVFELHPENKPPYDVLLTLLGVSRFREKYPQNAPNQKPNYSAGSIFFTQTGKRLGGSFLQYWRTFGGLPQQGYPISDELQEKSDLDGKIYTVQYFERAVMEWHPGNTPPYDVLLSHLGRFRYDARYKNASSNSSGRLLSKSVIGEPASGGRYLFWTDTSKGNKNKMSIYGHDYSHGYSHDPLDVSIYGYDLDQNKEFLVTDRSGSKGSLATDGKTLVWIEHIAFSGDIIRGYDLTHRQEHSILEVPGAGFAHLALDAGTLYYQGGWQNHYGLYARNLATGQEELISAQGQKPIASDNVVLWVEQVREGQCTGEPCPYLYSLHLRKRDGALKDRVLIVSRENSGFSGYSVSGDNVVWEELTLFEPRRAYLYNISSDSSKVISPRVASQPLISGNIVIWTEVPTGEPNGPRGSSIKAYDIVTGVIRTVIGERNALTRAWAIIKQDTIAFTVEQSGTVERELYLVGLGQK